VSRLARARRGAFTPSSGLSILAIIPVAASERGARSPLHSGVTRITSILWDSEQAAGVETPLATSQGHATRRDAMPTWFARLSEHPALPLVFLLLANIGFYASIASMLA
jgi:hypothetical protein